MPRLVRSVRSRTLVLEEPRRASPRNTEHNDRARGKLDRHGVHVTTAYLTVSMNQVRYTTGVSSARYVLSRAGHMRLDQPEGQAGWS